MTDDRLPSFLDEQARNAFNRVYQFLNEQGLWREEYLSLLAVGCQTCSHYLTLASAGVQNNEIEEMRLGARQILADFYYIDSDRVNLAVIDSDGLDRDIVDLCNPSSRG